MPSGGETVVRAAGGLVTRARHDGTVEILAVHRPRYDDWSLPKGKLDPGETAEAGARREVEEETGVRAVIVSELAISRYADRHGRPKEVRWFLMTVASEGPFEADHEVDEARWLPLDEAARLLSYPADRRLVEDHAAPGAELA